MKSEQKHGKKMTPRERDLRDIMILRLWESGTSLEELTKRFHLTRAYTTKLIEEALSDTP